MNMRSVSVFSSSLLDYRVPLTILMYMVTVPHIMVGLERMLNYRSVGLARFHCITHYASNNNYVQ